MTRKNLLSWKKQIVMNLILFMSLLIGYSQSSTFPYKLSYSKEITLGMSLLSTTIIDKYLDNNKEIDYLTFNQIENLNVSSISWIDRSATVNWSHTLAEWSDVTRAVSTISPVLLTLPHFKQGEWSNIIILGVMYFEGFGMNSNLTNITKNLTARKRPYVYNTTTISEDEKRWFYENSISFTYKSFFSGHTSSTFFSAVFLSKVVTDLYGKCALSYFTWGTTLLGAATTGYLRYKSGRHYPSDIFVGAIVGGSIGYLIPWLHQSNNNKHVTVLASGNQISVVYNFN